MKISRAKRQINYVGDSKDQECRAFFEKPSRDGIRVGLLVGAVEQDFRDFTFRSRLKSGDVSGEEGECGDADIELLTRERRSLDVLSVKKEARLSARALAEVDVGGGEEKVA